MRRALLVLAALGGVLASGASASAATPPPGAAISKSLDYVGRVPDSSLTSSLGGEGAANSTPEKPFRMTALDSFHPARNPPLGDAAAITECSAHSFEMSGPALAAAWYGQGLRVLDTSNARNLRQVAY
jgi:hypothetical protein